MATLWKILTRKKVIDPARAEESSLARVLTTFDLTTLGVGSTLGVGMYVLVGKVAKETAGPSVVLSFLIAAIASTFAALCYAEFGARAPRAGSAYIYSYVCVGEFIAFVIGWNLILEYVIGSASVARGMSLYIDALVNNSMKNAFIDIAPINIPYLSAYFDFLTFAITVVLSCGLAFGMKESSRVNNVFTTLNIFVVLFVIIAGSTKADLKNWELDAPKNITNGGSGGFFPFGIEGMLKGAATCFYGFVGFDCIATTGEEVKNPQKAIPIAIIVSLLVVFLAYFGTATVVTLMVPYYLQDVNSPIPHAFEEFGWEAAKWIVTLGGICALFASLFGAMFPLPRILYAMASDGLVFKFLGTVNSRFSTPVIGTLLAGLFTGLMGAMFEQDQLINMMSIGTLLAYTIVAASILLLRYSVDEEGYSLAHSDSDSSVSTYTDNRDLNPSGDSNESTDECAEQIEDDVSFVGLLRQCFNYRKFGRPTKLSEKLVSINVCVYCLLCLLLGLSLIYLVDDIAHGEIHAIVITSVLGLLMILTLMSIGTQPESKKALSFKVPLVPLVPALSILINIYLMLCLDVTTWIRFGVWMAVGLPIYFYSAHCYSKDVSQLAFKKNSISLGNSNSYVNFGYIHEGSKRGSCNSDSAYFEDDSTVEREEKNDVIHDILANLDNILERESRDTKVFNRKMSVDTVSNVSNTVLEENIVAIVHREDEPIIEEESDDLLNVPTVCCIEGGLEEEVGSLDSFKMVPGRISYEKSVVQMKSNDNLNLTGRNLNDNEIILENNENEGNINDINHSGIKNEVENHNIVHKQIESKKQINKIEFDHIKDRIQENNQICPKKDEENESGKNILHTNVENKFNNPDLNNSVIDLDIVNLTNDENGEIENVNCLQILNDVDNIKSASDSQQHVEVTSQGNNKECSKGDLKSLQNNPDYNLLQTGNIENSENGRENSKGDLKNVQNNSDNNLLQTGNIKNSENGRENSKGDLKNVQNNLDNNLLQTGNIENSENGRENSKGDLKNVQNNPDNNLVQTGDIKNSENGRENSKGDLINVQNNSDNNLLQTGNIENSENGNGNSKGGLKNLHNNPENNLLQTGNIENSENGRENSKGDLKHVKNNSDNNLLQTDNIENSENGNGNSKGGLKNLQNNPENNLLQTGNIENSENGRENSKGDLKNVQNNPDNNLVQTGNIENSENKKGNSKGNFKNLQNNPDNNLVQSANIENNENGLNNNSLELDNIEKSNSNILRYIKIEPNILAQKGVNNSNAHQNNNIKENPEEVKLVENNNNNDGLIKNVISDKRNKNSFENEIEIVPRTTQNEFPKDKSLKISIPNTLDIPKIENETPVTPEAVKRLDEILNAEEMTFIPIPPSMDDFEKSKVVKLPRVQSTRPKFLKKKSPAIPPIDYEEDVAVDTVKIGSKEHDNLKKKLNAILFNKSTGLPQPNKLTKPEVVEVEEESVNIRKKSITSIMDRIISEIPSKKEDEPDTVTSVIESNKIETSKEPYKNVDPNKEEEVVKVEDIRSKLNKLFAVEVASRRAPKKISAAISNITQELLKKDDVVEKGSSKTFPRNKPEHEDHKRLMQATLNSIKLRKLGGVDDS